ncbi:hypothetical protein Q0Z83_011300 [Actinoplanes sichuanensis]|uniref:Uncharacterized protein n=1 Tax=Actinoplanes sichuanensis TaxID=512349 RepID=A0ABW4APE0_9ACTN|nr:hypothetical protein [Actinoplanes sichuanensis]BEL02939.1 hypothetical protein Q0Z83_011300 [Actinoplanes sichuanensis]
MTALETRADVLLSLERHHDLVGRAGRIPPPVTGTEPAVGDTLNRMVGRQWQAE